MNSWDFWDTLGARRFMRDEVHWRTREGKADPWGFEYANVIPIQENVGKVRPDDLIVSDYGDGTPRWAEFVSSLLLKFGLKNRAVVTPGGKYEGTVWASLPSRPAIHTGDNQKADVDSANAHGIKGVLSALSPLSESEQYLVGKGFPNLARVCREARLTTYSADYRGIELLQTGYNFPVLFLASIVLNREFPTETLLMSARDCFMWLELMQALFGRGVYWYTSVIARTNAGPNYHRYIQSLGPDPVLVDISGSGNSFMALPQYKHILMYKPTHGRREVPCMVSSSDCWRLEQANTAPHEKCVGVDDDLKPVFVNKSKTDFCTEPCTLTAVNAFRVAIGAMKHYDLSSELNTPSELCKEVMSHLMHQYIKFKEAVEPLRLLAIRDDQ